MDEASGRRLKVLEPREGYARAATAYDGWYWAEFWRRNEAPLVERWLRGVPPGLVLDVGSGTGFYRIDLEAIGHCWIALDLSREMLSIQRRRLVEWGVRRDLQLVQGDARALPFRDRVFDAVLCTRVLTHVESFAPVFEELARVTKAGAVCVFSDVHADHPYTHMSIAVGGERVEVLTYHHTVEELRDTVSVNGSFKLLDLDEHYLGNLRWAPP